MSLSERHGGRGVRTLVSGVLFLVSGFVVRVSILEFRFSGCGFRVLGFGVRVSVFQVSGFVFVSWVFRFRVSDFGFSDPAHWRIAETASRWECFSAVITRNLQVRGWGASILSRVRRHFSDPQLTGQGFLEQPRWPPNKEGTRS